MSKMICIITMMLETWVGAGSQLLFMCCDFKRCPYFTYMRLYSARNKLDNLPQNKGGVCSPGGIGREFGSAQCHFVGADPVHPRAITLV